MILKERKSWHLMRQIDDVYHDENFPLCPDKEAESA